jgi:sporozoite microneme protein 2
MMKFFAPVLTLVAGASASMLSNTFVLDPNNNNASVLSNTVRVSASKFPNIDFLGSGYNIMFGNPHTRSADPGFTSSPVLNLSNYDQRQQTADGRYLLPNGINVRALPACSKTIVASSFSGANSYSSILSGSVKVTAAGWGAKFSANTQFKEASRMASSNKQVSMSASASCGSYTASTLSFRGPTLHKYVPLNCRFAAQSGACTWD